jgi:hypothetical protein
LQSDIQRFRAIFGKNHSVMVGAIEMPGKGFTTGLYGLKAGDSKPMRASAGVGAQLQRRMDGGEDVLRLFAARGGIVKINHNKHLAKIDSI